MVPAFFRRSALALGIAATLFPGAASAQKPPVALKDYGQWESLGFPVLSADGGWISYSVSRDNEENELRLRSVAGREEAVLPFGGGPVFSGNSAWMAYRIQPSTEESAALRKEDEPVRNALGLVKLDGLQESRVDGVQDFAFSDDGAFLAMHRYASQDDEGSVGRDLLVRNLLDGTDMSFGNVGEFAWSEDGHLLALLVSAADKAGNGVQLYEPSSGVLRVLDSEASDYEGLAWRAEGPDLAVFRSDPDSTYADTAFAILAWKGLDDDGPEGFSLPVFGREEIPPDMAVVPYAPLRWSEDGRTLFFGVQGLEPKPEEEPEVTARDSSTVEVWNAVDVDVIPRQKVMDDRIREESYLTAWHLAPDRVVVLGDEEAEDVQVLGGGERWGLGLDPTPWEADGRFFPRRTDLYRIDLRSGEKSPIQPGVRYFYPGPAGNKLLYTEEEAFWIYDLNTGERVRVAEDVPTSLVNEVDDHPMPERRPWGLAGWTGEDGSVLLYDRHDVWEVASDGSGSHRLTRGAEDDVRHRYARIDEEAEAIDLDGPVYFSVFGEWTKKSGFARMASGAEPSERLVFEDRSLGWLQKADDAEVYVYRSEAFDDSPDLFAAGPRLRNPRQLTASNPFQDEYAWGWTELVDYDNPVSDARLQGVLYYPAGYEAGKQYPMIVYYYERVSDGIHRYRVPSERSAYNPAVFTAEGYFVFMPDITFVPSDPGFSALACVETAVKKVLEKGVVDPDRIGLTGHSWGGYETVFLATHSTMFGAAVAGAPLTNLVSMYGMMFWNTGLPETSHYQWSQERMVATLWEYPEAYLRNSPVMDFPKLDTPLLMAFGDQDGSVDWHQGIEAYNFARRLDKEFVLLVYRGENHSNRQKANQVDYHHRQLEWFAHYLKGEQAPKWITEGVSWREQEAGRAGSRR
jgi:dipeptidyl aminopeptidase/acylaminoacyl peptidase